MTDLLERGEGEPAGFGKDEGSPGDAGGSYERVAGEMDGVEECVFVGDVVVVAWKCVGGVICFEANEVGDVVAVEVEDVVYGRSLLHDELNAVEIGKEG